MELGDFATAWMVAALRTATPLLLVLLGELMTQRTGIINLGVEGQMLVGACAGFAFAASVGDPWLALLVGGGTGLALSLVHAGLCLGARANQIGSGVAVWMLGLGLSAYFGRPFVGAKVEGMAPLAAGAATGLAVLDRLLGQLTPTTLMALLLVPVLAVWLHRSRPGRRWRAVGESFEAARALGISPNQVRLQAILLGGFLAGVAGAVLSVDYTQTWAQDMTKGQGLVAVALVIVARWNPWLALPTALLFGGAEAGVFRLQAAGVPVSSYLLASAPYVLCIAVVTLGYLRLRGSGGMPAELARIFR
jgi:general nucleoside transport system permease protein